MGDEMKIELILAIPLEEDGETEYRKIGSWEIEVDEKMKLRYLPGGREIKKVVKEFMEKIK